jgi:hypothetical protein
MVCQFGGGGSGGELVPTKSNFLTKTHSLKYACIFVMELSPGNIYYAFKFYSIEGVFHIIRERCC